MVAAAALAVCCPAVASAASTWTIQSVPLPAGASAGTLFSVSCPTATRCAAVGNGGHASVDSWNGRTWSVRSVPLPAGATGGSLFAVSCASATSCTAIGYYFKATGPKLMLAEHWNGSTWSVRSVPGPSGSRGSELFAVSWSSATSCTAVGDYVTSAGSTQTLAVRWNGSTWSVQATPDPAGSTNDTLQGVSCASVTSCTAVGSYAPPAGLPRMLAEHWNGHTWSVQPSPAPAGSSFASLSGVSCASAVSCMAVGGSDAGALAEQWNGGTWSVRAVPAPGGRRIFSLPGVSCASATGCTAVGFLFNSSSAPVAVAEHWNGRAWSVQQTAQPADQKLFSAVSCTASRTCTAVGASAMAGSTITLPLAERE
jgi:hypothetical protein